MDKSITQRALRIASRETAKHLSAHGFRRQGLHLHRHVGSLFHGINFQASRWGSAASGKFTVNLIVTSPAIYTGWIGPFPSNPASATFPIQMRIGSLMPDRSDYWWPVGVDTELEALAAEVAESVEHHGLPFFAAYQSNDDLLSRLRSGICPGCTRPLARVVHALVAAEMGLRQEALEALKLALAESEVSSFSERVRGLAERLGLANTL